MLLAEELLLLALRDEEGAVARGASLALKFGLSGALLAELVLKGKLQLVEKARVEVVDPSPAGDALLDGALAAVAGGSRPRSLRDWVLSLGQGKIKRLQDRLAERLVAQGILREQEGRFLWVFATHRYPALDAAAEQGIRERVRAVVLGGVSPDERILILLSLIKACRLQDEVFDRDERKVARRRLDDLTRAEAAGQAVANAVAAIQAATMAAVSASVAASTVATSSS